MTDTDDDDSMDAEPAAEPCGAVYPAVDLVCQLIETPFAQRPAADRHYLIGCARPQPMLQYKGLVVSKATGRQVARNFRSPWYSEYSWLCGSYYLNRLFCWPCLLLTKRKNTWNSCGFEDIRNATRALHKHEDTPEHLRTMVEFIRLQKKQRTAVSDALQESSRLQTKIFNDGVKLNRQLIKIMIDAVLYLTKQEVPFQEQTDNFKDLTNAILANSPFEIQTHYGKIKNSFDLDDFHNFQNGLVKCISEYLSSHIEKEIEKANVYSFQVYDATDIFQSPYCSLIIRFVNSSGALVEHFLGFQQMQGSKTAEEFYSMLKPISKRFNFSEKLVAQYYDGACVMTESLDELQFFVKQEAPRAVFVPTLSQHLNIVIEQSLCRNLQCRSFFSYITGMRSFFKESPKQMEVFNEVISGPNSDFRTSSNAQLINTIVNEWHGMTVVWQSITADLNNDPAVTRESECYLNKFHDFEFAFLAIVFDEIFSLCEILFNMLQEKSLDVEYTVGNTKWAFELLENKKTDDTFQNIHQSASSKIQATQQGWTGDQQILLKVEYLTGDELTESYRKVFLEIVDSVLNELRLRFRDIEAINYVSLADSTKFQSDPVVVTDLAANMKEIFPNVVKGDRRLKSQLEIIFKDSQYRDIPLQELIDLLIKHDLRDVMQDAFSLFCLVLTIPCTEPSVKEFEEYSFGRIRRMKKYFHAVSQESLTHMAFLSIEKDMLNHVMKTEPFYEDLIDKFSLLKDRPEIDLTHRNLDVD